MDAISLLSLIVFIAFHAGHCCKICSFGSWMQWGTCSKNCGGGGIRSRQRLVCCPKANSYDHCIHTRCQISNSDIWQSSDCNQICRNDGEFEKKINVTVHQVGQELVVKKVSLSYNNTTPMWKNATSTWVLMSISVPWNNGFCRINFISQPNLFIFGHNKDNHNTSLNPLSLLQNINLVSRKLI